MLIVAILTVQHDRADDFRRYETIAAQIIARHGGAIERVVVEAAPPDAETFRELHLVRFPDEAALRAYRADPELTALAELRASAIAATETWPATDGPTYG